MTINFYVPKGKVLFVKKGGYRFIGPCQVNLGGKAKLPDCYEDGSPLYETDEDIEKSTGKLPDSVPEVVLLTGIPNTLDDIESYPDASSEDSEDVDWDASDYDEEEDDE